MQLHAKTALVTGGASGLGEATVRRVVAAGGQAIILDMNEELGTALASDLGDAALFVKTDVTDETSVADAIKRGLEAYSKLDIAVNCAGIGPPKTVINRDGQRSPLAHFETIVKVNLIGSYTVLSQAAEAMLANEPGADGERGVIINTASIAAYDGQIGQSAYAASKGGIVGMTLPIAREFARHGIRVMTIAPGYIHTPLFNGLPEEAVTALVATTLFPKRLGKPEEYAQLVQSIVENPMLNGETIRMDGAVRMPAR